MPHPSVPSASLFSLAPTAMTFLAVAGARSEPLPGPSFPVEKKYVICWLPASVGSASRTNASKVAESVL